MAGGSAEGRSVRGPGMALYLVQGTWNWPEGWKGNGEVEGQHGEVRGVAHARFSGDGNGAVTGALLSFP